MRPLRLEDDQCWKWEIDSNTFENVNVQEFKNFRPSTISSFFLTVLQLALTGLLYILDCYTCVRLLAYNSWGSEIEPAIPFKISRWIFSGCIVASIVLLFFEFAYGIKISHTKNISLTYTNQVSRNLLSLKGYSYFCLYDQITPKSSFEYCGFFIYFTLKNCLKLILADSPRQVINGLTLYSVIKNQRSKMVSSYKAIKEDGIKETWAIVFTIMGISFVIWLIFLIKFSIALSLYIYIKFNQEGFNLKKFVCLKISEKVEMLSSIHHTRTLRKLEEKQLKQKKSNLDLKSNNTFLKIFHSNNSFSSYLSKPLPACLKENISVTDPYNVNSTCSGELISPIYDEYNSSKYCSKPNLKLDMSMENVSSISGSTIGKERSKGRLPY